MQQQFGSALAEFEAALKTNPRLASSLYGRGLTKLKQGDIAGAEADMAAAKMLQDNIADEFGRYGIK
jgi:hypothetical protein